MPKILLPSEARPVPRTYREALESLGVIKGFDPSVAETLGRRANLRHILTHEYLDVGFRSIRRFLQDAGPGTCCDLQRDGQDPRKKRTCCDGRIP